MAYQVTSKKSGKVYFLHARKQKLRNTPNTVTLYYFAGQERAEAIKELPAGYEVTENAKTGLPMLRKKK